MNDYIEMGWDDGTIATATVSTYPLCNHSNGRFYSIPFWIFNKRFFICHDCDAMIHGEDLKEFLDAKI